MVINIFLLQMEYILRAKRSELTSKLLMSGSDGLSNDLRKMDPETQARLETLLEAAGTLYDQIMLPKTNSEILWIRLACTTDETVRINMFCIEKDLMVTILVSFLMVSV